LWSGVVDAAEENGASLICFAGEILRDSEGLPSPANVAYDLAGAETLDGLVSWASSVGGALEHQKIASFHRRYLPLPMVSITLPMTGIPTVLIDSYRGMQDMIDHLIEVHGYRRLCFIRGLESHYYAQERYRAYVDALETHGISFDLQLVTTPGDFVPQTGIEGIRLLLDERKLRPQADFEAVLTVSDLPALGALRELQARDIQVPEAVALVGCRPLPHPKM
jgi:DNA-binding LacI/PurR family transcriptional regulator